MKITVIQENLTKPLGIIGRVLPTGRDTLPILNNFFLEAREGTIKIFAGNLETTIIVNIPGKIIEEGKVFIPAKTFLAVLPSLTGEKLTLEKKEKLLEIKGKRTTINLRTELTEDFPLIKLEGKVQKGEFSRGLIEKIDSLVSFASSKDKTRAVLTGVFFKLEEEKLNIVGTDGFRLSLLKEKIKKKTIPQDILLPAEIISYLEQIIKEEGEEKVRVSFSQAQAAFFFPQVKIFTRLIEGEFPDYQKIIPQSYTTRIVVDREEFLRAVKLSSVFAREAANILKLRTGKGKLFVSANSPQTGENESEIEAKTEGEGIKIAFNFRFLRDFLNSGKSEEVIIETSGSLNPGVFRFSDKANFLHIIMPVRLQES